MKLPQPLILVSASIGCGPRTCLAHIGYSLTNADVRGMDLSLSLWGVPDSAPTKDAVEFASVAATGETGTFLEATATKSDWVRLRAR